MEKKVIICNICRKEVESYHIIIVQSVEIHIGFECEGRSIKDLMIELGATKRKSK